MPEIDYAFLADAVEAPPGRKFSVLGGGITSLGGAAFPLRHPHIALVVGLRLGPSELGREHDLGLSLVDPAGRELASAAGRFAAAGTGDGRPATLTVGIDLWNVVFQEPGEHAFRIGVDGGEQEVLPLLVVITPGEGIPPAPGDGGRPS